jgi:ABC-2 type transport system ATP-binding protein
MTSSATTGARTANAVIACAPVRRHRGLIAVIAASVCLLAAPGAAARDATVTSFDGTQINTHFYPGNGADRAHRAPTILQGPGWSQSGDTEGGGAGAFGGPFGISNINTFIDHGYNVVTWDPRGFGQSGGTVEIDDPRYEGRDVQALLDFVAKQPEAQLDARGDPRAGMAGGSYGGGIQLVTAAIDPRVDAIAPTIAWHSLLTSLFPERSVKEGWGSLLAALGIEGATLPGGLQDPAAAPGRQDPHFYDTVINAEATGSVPQEDLDWFAAHGPGDLVNKITIPTLFIQGTVDTLFPLDEAVVNFNALRSHNVPTKMIWFCGGHGTCLTGNVGQDYLDQRVLAWFDRYLRRQDIATGPRFVWVADDGALRTSRAYPLRSAGTLRGNGSGTLPLVAGQGSGALILATPAANAINVSIPGPAVASNVVGPPRLSLTYSGTGGPQKTFVYAQIVNPRNNQVLGNAATPIPIVLDGQPHSISRALEMVAARAPAGSGYILQLTPSSTLYDIQRSSGVVSFSSVSISMPLGNPVG